MWIEPNDDVLLRIHIPQLPGWGPISNPIMELALVSTVLDPNAAFPVSSRLYAVILLLPFWDTKTLSSWTTRPDGLDSPEDKDPPLDVSDLAVFRKHLHLGLRARDVR